MQEKTILSAVFNKVRTFLLGLCATSLALVIFLTPSQANAAYVPVIDVWLEEWFPDMWEKWLTEDWRPYWEDMEDWITSGDYVATEDCAVTTEFAELPLIYNDGGGTDPYTILYYIQDPSDVEINNGDSLRCLLEELIEWKKLEINQTMHQMVKEYFADAANHFMSKRILNVIQAAQIQYAQTGITRHTVDEDGNPIIYNSSAVPANREIWNNRYAENEMVGFATEIRDTGLAGTTDLNVCEPWQESSAAAVEVGTIFETTDTLYTLPAVTSCHVDGLLADINDFDDYSSGNFSDTEVGPWAAFMGFSAQNPVRVQSSLVAEAYSRIGETKAEQNAYLSAGGDHASINFPTGASEDPFNRDELLTTSNANVGDNTVYAVNAGITTAEGIDEIGEKVTANAVDLQYDTGAQEDGVLFYDANELLDWSDITKSGSPMEDAYNEFRQTIYNGYFGIDKETRDWAYASMAYIWDKTQYEAYLEDFLDQLATIEARITP